MEHEKAEPQEQPYSHHMLDTYAAPIYFSWHASST